MLCLLAILVPACAVARDMVLAGADATASMPSPALPCQVRSGRWISGQALAVAQSNEPLFEPKKRSCHHLSKPQFQYVCGSNGFL